MKRHMAGGPAENETKLSWFNSDTNPSATTHTRRRFTRMCRSTGTCGCRLAPKAQSYFDLTVPKFTCSRAMPPMPLVSNANSDRAPTGTDSVRFEEGAVLRKRIGAVICAGSAPYRSSANAASAGAACGGNAAMCLPPTKVDCRCRGVPCVSNEARNGASSSTKSQCCGGMAVTRRASIKDHPITCGKWTRGSPEPLPKISCTCRKFWTPSEARLLRVVRKARGLSSTC